MRHVDPDRFYDNFRMSPERFDHLLSLLENRLQHWPTHKIPISSAERLCVTLKVLSQGLSMRSAAATFRLGASTVNTIFNQTCMIIWDVLWPQFVIFPKTPDEWRKISDAFGSKWNFPNCIGAIDGKHMAIKKPPASGSDFYNYKGFCSIVLLAVVDADYNFIYVDIGGAGRDSDASLFGQSELVRRMDNGQLQLPPDSCLPDQRPFPARIEPMVPLPPLPHVIVGDAAFPLKRNLMRPYPSVQRGLEEDKKIFNYRLSRARRISENAFGILVQRFRMFGRPIEATVANAKNIVKAAICLHNYLRLTEGESTFSGPKQQIPDLASIPSAFKPSPRQGANRGSYTAVMIRDYFKDYFLSPQGAPAWLKLHQEQVAASGNY